MNAITSINCSFVFCSHCLSQLGTYGIIVLWLVGKAFRDCGGREQWTLVNVLRTFLKFWTGFINIINFCINNSCNLINAHLISVVYNLNTALTFTIAIAVYMHDPILIFSVQTGLSCVRSYVISCSLSICNSKYSCTIM